MVIELLFFAISGQFYNLTAFLSLSLIMFQAKKFKGENMMLALDLIEYDPIYQKVFELVFGGVSLCLPEIF